jgi:hypothetical protein
MYFKKYWEFVNYCSFPLGIVINHYCNKYNTPAIGQVVVFLMFAPIHVILYIPGTLFGMIVGVPYTLYKYFTSDTEEKFGNGNLEVNNRCT